ncbi:MAG: LysR substrate-binding domain-containing protein, partial [Serpentinimonas sp.]|nr:LysR substrate-binding domain-containing protein [Serpentinimonas sp.]
MRRFCQPLPDLLVCAMVRNILLIDDSRTELLHLCKFLWRSGYRVRTAQSAEEAMLELGKQVVSGTVRLTCTDAVLGSLLLPALARFMPSYPALALELVTSNDFSNVSRRDADLALRLT